MFGLAPHLAIGLSGIHIEGNCIFDMIYARSFCISLCVCVCVCVCISVCVCVCVCVLYKIKSRRKVL